MKWYKVPGYQVEVTKNGKHVRNSVTTKRIKFYNYEGYKLVRCKTDEDKKTIKGLHQLIALTFIGPTKA